LQLGFLDKLSRAALHSACTLAAFVRAVCFHESCCALYAGSIAFMRASFAMHAFNLAAYSSHSASDTVLVLFALLPLQAVANAQATRTIAARAVGTRIDLRASAFREG
jgi:hypothetical protein